MSTVKRAVPYKNIKFQALDYLEELKKRLVAYRKNGYDSIDIASLEEDLDKIAFLLLDSDVKILKRKDA